MGLLTKANLIGDDSFTDSLTDAAVEQKHKSLAFSDFVKTNNLQICALFEFNQESFCIKNSIGFDLESLQKSVSTKDFWAGISENNDVNVFRQFFSSQLNEKIKTVNVIKLNENSFFMLCNRVPNQNLKNQLMALDTSKLNEEFFYIFTFHETKIKICLIDNSLIQENYKTAFFNEIVNRINCIYFNEHADQKDKNNMLNFKLLAKHLLLNLSEITADISNYIKIEQA